MPPGSPLIQLRDLSRAWRVYDAPRTRATGPARRPDPRPARGRHPLRGAAPDPGRLTKDALEVIGIDNVRFTPDRIAGAISKAKNQLQTPEKYEPKASDFFSQTVARVYYEYEKRLREANAVDFDDLLMLPALALRHDEDLRAELDSRFRFVLIDEYQDTNAAQYEIARRLSVDNP